MVCCDSFTALRSMTSIPPMNTICRKNEIAITISIPMSAPFPAIAYSRFSQALLRLRFFPLVRLFSCFHSGSQRTLFPVDDFLAALDQVLGAFAQLSRLSLRIVTAGVSLFLQQLACFLA